MPTIFPCPGAREGDRRPHASRATMRSIQLSARTSQPWIHARANSQRIKERIRSCQRRLAMIDLGST